MLWTGSGELTEWRCSRWGNKLSEPLDCCSQTSDRELAVRQSRIDFISPLSVGIFGQVKLDLAIILVGSISGNRTEKEDESAEIK